MRSASSSVTRGSISSRSGWPLTLSEIGTAPGPTALTVLGVVPGPGQDTGGDTARADCFQETAPAETGLVFASGHRDLEKRILLFPKVAGT